MGTFISDSSTLLLEGPSDVLCVEIESAIDVSLHDQGVLSASNGQSGIILY